MEYIMSIINSIKKVFDVSEENISSLAVMLADIEAEHLYNRFSAEEQVGKYLIWIRLEVSKEKACL